LTKPDKFNQYRYLLLPLIGFSIILAGSSRYHCYR